MNNDKKETANGEFHRIEPAQIRLTGETTPVTAPAAAPAHRHAGLWITLALLLTAVLGVVFVLPRWVGPATPPGNTAQTPPATGNAAAGGTAQSQPAGGGDAPWNEAQQARLRKQSQAVLAQMLDLQEELKKHGVQHWAGEDYKQALAAAASGDDAYSRQRFQAALDNYNSALKGLKALRDSMDQVYTGAMEKGGRALAAGDAATAADAYSTALLIRPGDSQARTGKLRAATLDQVMGLIRQGEQQMQNGALEDAQASFSQALKTDPRADRARQRLQEVDNRLRDQEFGRWMSQGYAALDNNRPDQARQAFSQALKIKAGAAEARAGLEQAELRLSNRRISAALDAAHRAETEEDWQAAMDHYRKALSEDATLTAAQQGLHHATLRAALDQRLASTIAQPLRLSDSQVYREAQALRQAALTIKPAGPRLAQQLEALGRLLVQARTPVAVPLRSDNQTHVTIYKVGDMGQFQEKSVNLIPGHYVAVGERTGYRDVRVEFTVHANQPVVPVVVQVSEKIP
jgi:hypothetical protein